MAYTTINKSTEHFDIRTYSASGGGSVSDVAFQPDFLWFKNRTGAGDHGLMDAVRGITKILHSNDNNAEATSNGSNDFNAFSSNGFNYGASSALDTGSGTPCTWLWKAGSSNTSVSASGSGNGAYNACTHRANTTAGFSIVQYTGRNGDIGNGNETKVTHGLGVKPNFIIIKRTDASESWVVRGGTSPLQSDYHVSLNTTDARSGSFYVGQAQNDNATHFVVGNSGRTNQQGGTYIAYVFANKTGYSKFGSYTGNGNADGTFVYTGFKPAFVMAKNTAVTSSWEILDSTRNTFNPTAKSIFPDGTGVEYDYTNRVDLLSNGFKWRTNSSPNESGNSIIYMAFAKAPLVGTNGVTAKAR